MLNIIRKNAKNLIWFAAIVFIGATFLGFGSDIFSKKKSQTLKINSTNVSIQEVYASLQKQLIFYRDRLNMDIDEKMRENIKNSVVEGIIEKELLLQEAEKHDISITDKQVEEHIRTVPYFQREGNFDKKMYLQVLEINNISPADYEEDLRKSLAITALKKMLNESIKVSENEVMDEYVKRNDGNMEKFEEEKDSLRDNLLREKQYMYYRQWLNSVRKNANIKNNIDKFGI